MPTSGRFEPPRNAVTRKCRECSVKAEMKLRRGETQCWNCYSRFNAHSAFYDRDGIKIRDTGATDYYGSSSQDMRRRTLLTPTVFQSQARNLSSDTQPAPSSSVHPPSKVSQRSEQPVRQPSAAPKVTPSRHQHSTSAISGAKPDEENTEPPFGQVEPPPLTQVLSQLHSQVQPSPAESFHGGDVEDHEKLYQDIKVSEKQPALVQNQLDRDSNKKMVFEDEDRASCSGTTTPINHDQPSDAGEERLIESITVTATPSPSSSFVRLCNQLYIFGQNTFSAALTRLFLGSAGLERPTKCVCGNF